MARGTRAEDQTTLQMALVGYQIEKQKIEEKIEQLTSLLRGKRGALTSSADEKPPALKRVLSAAARKRISAAQRKRAATGAGSKHSRRLRCGGIFRNFLLNQAPRSAIGTYCQGGDQIHRIRIHSSQGLLFIGDTAVPGATAISVDLFQQTSWALVGRQRRSTRSRLGARSIRPMSMPSGWRRRSRGCPSRSGW